MHALNQFSAAYPDCVSSSKASHLLPYLRHSTAVRFFSFVQNSSPLTCFPTRSLQPDDQAISISLLRVFNRSIRKMPKTSISFAQSLEKKVLPLINGAMGGWMVRISFFQQRSSLALRLPLFALVRVCKSPSLVCARPSTTSLRTTSDWFGSSEVAPVSPLP